MNVVRLDPASPSEDLRALQEVDEFAKTDMGWGGPGRWTYRKLNDSQVDAELLRIATHGTGGDDVDYATIQPCPLHDARSMDRICVKSWNLAGGRWTFVAVFDGHGGHDTVNYAAERIPAKVYNGLRNLLTPLRSINTMQEAITMLLKESIVDTDRSIADDFMRLFDPSAGTVARMSERTIDAILHTQSGSEETPLAVKRCMQGSTALLLLVDPSKQHMWMSNVGDCRAVLVSRKSEEGRVVARRLSDVHNGTNISELQRIRREHPGKFDLECIVDGRVLGFLEPTRALGDTWTKLPRVYSERILVRTPEFHAAGLSSLYTDRVRTPPYLSNTPQVLYRRIKRLSAANVLDASSHRVSAAFARARGKAKPGPTSPKGAKGDADETELALVLCSDGLIDLYQEMNMDENAYLQRWAQIVDRSSRPSQRTAANQRASLSTNAAIALLRDAIGYPDLTRASANLTVEMEERWMDDTSVVVVKFD